MSVRFVTRRHAAALPRSRISVGVPRTAAELAPTDWQAAHAAADKQLPRYVKDLRAALVAELSASVVTAAANAATPADGLLILKPVLDALVAATREAVRTHAAPVIARTTRLAYAAVEGLQAAQAHAEPELVLSFDRVNLEALSVAEDGLSQWLNALPAEQYAIAQGLLVQTIGGELDVRAFARQLRDRIGLDERSTTALANFERGLSEQGIKQATIDKRVSDYADRLRRQRAERIARTETLNAANLGQMYLWENAVRDGLLDVSRTKTMWIVTPDDRLCVLCRVMTGERGVIPFGHTFDTPRGHVLAPPMHPLCRCTVGLVFDDAPVSAPVSQPLVPTEPTYSIRDSIGSVHAPHAKRVETALKLIDAVHAIPKPTYQLPIQAERSQSFLGVFRSGRLNGNIYPKSIGMTNLKNGDYSATFVHEVGHYLHQQVFLSDPNGFVASALGGAAENRQLIAALPAEMHPIIQAINDSPEYQALQTQLSEWQAGKPEHSSLTNARMADYYGYLLNVKELIARSYSQYIAEVTDDSGMRASLEQHASDGRQWSSGNFAPIRQAYDDYFKLKGWLRT